MSASWTTPFRGMSYWVTMTFVSTPLGRGSVLNVAGRFFPAPFWLIVARYRPRSTFVSAGQ